ncbi:hypothetical protein MBM_02905 [Drepanopeziza brunnea f. sp. 'multigermtubi' MB_m1]|uniref:Uncharacterized protein n=1 Tax=Marssonina brunnea f. sp. multigermtubi (strain MB_m1) TaxID=1072389 RepID=K1XD16_MARBU|nr:uncharacterized protein MBM_02905 [Drepanopeziza brunnea f. sp. 'multigermtubi' MB_m1]EKD18663.1 hypothetical protein MBM_02905 [Drepanopeziza brunnea f. sp. 'multigermtubi' MB_m1]
MIDGHRYTDANIAELDYRLYLEGIVDAESRVMEVSRSEASEPFPSAGVPNSDSAALGTSLRENLKFSLLRLTAELDIFCRQLGRRAFKSFSSPQMAWPLKVPRTANRSSIASRSPCGIWKALFSEAYTVLLLDNNKKGADMGLCVFRTQTSNSLITYHKLPNEQLVRFRTRAELSSKTKPEPSRYFLITVEASLPMKHRRQHRKSEADASGRGACGPRHEGVFVVRAGRGGGEGLLAGRSEKGARECQPGCLVALGLGYLFYLGCIYVCVCVFAADRLEGEISNLTYFPGSKISSSLCQHKLERAFRETLTELSSQHSKQSILPLHTHILICTPVHHPSIMHTSVRKPPFPRAKPGPKTSN